MTKRKQTDGLNKPFIYNEAVSLTKDHEHRFLNFLEFRSIARIVKPTFGPLGLTKLIIQGDDDDFITQKGYRIATTFKNKLPIVKILKKLVNTQQKNCGDGTKFVMLTTGLLLEKAKNLIEQGLSPQIIIQGFYIGMKQGLEIIENNKLSLNKNNNLRLDDLIGSIITNKYGKGVKRHFTNLILQLANDPDHLINKSWIDNRSDVYTRKVPGKSMIDSELVKGFIIYKNKPNIFTPNKIVNPKIILIQKSIDYFINENHKTIYFDPIIEDPVEFEKLSKFEYDFYIKLSNSLNKKGINAIFCQKRVNEEIINTCSRLGMIIVDMVGEKEIRALSEMLNVNVISDLDNIVKEDIGEADSVEFGILTGDEMLFIRKKDVKTATFVLRGGTKHVLTELQESIETAIQVAIKSDENDIVLPSAGAIEIELSHHIQQYSKELPNKLQLVVSEYAKVFENLIGFIVINAGEDPLDIIPNLIKQHRNNQRYDGFDVNSKSIVNVVEAGILEGYNAKVHGLKISTEMACQVIRVDDLIMIHDRKLYEEIEARGKQRKNEQRNEKIRKYIKQNEADFV